MALKDLFAHVSDELEVVYNRVQYNVEKDRKKLIARIDATKAKWTATEAPKGQRDFKLKNNVVAFSPALAGKKLVLEGREVLHIAAEKFADFLDLFKKEVEAGSLDKEITEAATGGTGKPRATRKTSSGGGAGWSDERRANYAKTIAARKAGK